MRLKDIKSYRGALVWRLWWCTWFPVVGLSVRKVVKRAVFLHRKQRDRERNVPWSCSSWRGLWVLQIHCLRDTECLHIASVTPKRNCDQANQQNLAGVSLLKGRWWPCLVCQVSQQWDLLSQGEKIRQNQAPEESSEGLRSDLCILRYRETSCFHKFVNKWLTLFPSFLIHCFLSVPNKSSHLSSVLHPYLWGGGR